LAKSDYRLLKSKHFLVKSKTLKSRKFAVFAQKHGKKGQKQIVNRFCRTVFLTADDADKRRKIICVPLRKSALLTGNKSLLAGSKSVRELCDV
jgi:hypothetical protein